jgi:hypothetical protein
MPQVPVYGTWLLGFLLPLGAPHADFACGILGFSPLATNHSPGAAPFGFKGAGLEPTSSTIKNGV